MCVCVCERERERERTNVEEKERGATVKGEENTITKITGARRKERETE